MSEVRPPSGQAPPERARLPGGGLLNLWELAGEICSRYRGEYPDEADRYGDAGVAWCVHDNQHIHNWAVLDLGGVLELNQKLDWLAGVLAARDFPLERLARDLELAAAVVAERVAGSHAGLLADRLRAGAAQVAERAAAG